MALVPQHLEVESSSSRLDPDIYLETSPESIDGGEKVGRRPRSMARSDLLALRGLGPPTSPVKALRARCLHCCGFEKTEVRKCADFACPSWPFRMGHNPFVKGAVTGPDVDAKRRATARGRAARDTKPSAEIEPTDPGAA